MSFARKKGRMANIRLLAVGDIVLQTKDDENPFQSVKQTFADKDILFGNLETVLSNEGKKAEKAVVLYTSPDKAVYLKEAGFDVLNVANNHIMDLGPKGCSETLEVLNQNGLNFIGVSNHKFIKPWAIIENKGLRLGFLGYLQGGLNDPQSGVIIRGIDEAEIIRDIEILSPQCDLVIISLHWGIEKVFYPSPKQVVLAHKLIDTGATIVLGHHPHVVQGIERYKDGLIAYSLGNFQFEFDPEECSGQRDKRTNQSVILSLELSKDGLEAYDIIPVMIDEHFAPYMPVEEKRDEIRHFISKISEPISLKTLNERWWFEEIAWEYLSGNIKSWIVRIKRYGFSHLLQCIRWLLSPFCVRCYVAIMRRRIKRVLGKT